MIKKRGGFIMGIIMGLIALTILTICSVYLLFGNPIIFLILSILIVITVGVLISKDM